jgi:hypothetical protein
VHVQSRLVTISCAYREDVAQAKVVVGLLAQLLLAQAVQHKELLGQGVVLLVATRRQLDLQ